MPAAIARGAAALALLAVAAPATAVGLGPLERTGVTDGDRKGFRLILTNPYPTAERFELTSIGWDDETAVDRVAIFPDRLVLGANKSRQVLVIVRDLAPGETYRFRVCGARAEMPEGVMVHARVCSKLTARRLP